MIKTQTVVSDPLALICCWIPSLTSTTLYTWAVGKLPCLTTSESTHHKYLNGHATLPCSASSASPSSVLFHHRRNLARLRGVNVLFVYHLNAHCTLWMIVNWIFKNLRCHWSFSVNPNKCAQLGQAILTLVIYSGCRSLINLVSDATN